MCMLFKWLIETTRIKFKELIKEITMNYDKPKY